MEEPLKKKIQKSKDQGRDRRTDQEGRHGSFETQAALTLLKKKT